MQTSALKSQKNIGGLSDFHVNNWEDGKKELERVPCI